MQELSVGLSYELYSALGARESKDNCSFQEVVRKSMHIYVIAHAYSLENKAFITINAASKKITGVLNLRDSEEESHNYIFMRVRLSDSIHSAVRKIADEAGMAPRDAIRKGM